jgi:hypothetical protein
MPTPLQANGHISKSEYSCQCCGAMPPDFYDHETGEIMPAYIFLLGTFEKIREQYGAPIPISSGFRCTRNELMLYHRLIAQGVSTASPFGVHIFGLALDIQPPKKDILKLVEIIKKTTPRLRLGWKMYLANQNPHIHIDAGFLIEPRYGLNLIPEAEW